MNKKDLVAKSKNFIDTHKTELAIAGGFVAGSVAVVITYAVRDYYRIPFLVDRKHLPNLAAGKGMVVFEYNGVDYCLLKDLSKN